MSDQVRAMKERMRQRPRAVWLSKLSVGDRVVVTGNLLMLSGVSPRAIVCVLSNRQAGIIGIVESVTSKSFRVFGRYFSRQLGITSANHARYRMELHPLMIEK